MDYECRGALIGVPQGVFLAGYINNDCSGQYECSGEQAARSGADKSVENSSLLTFLGSCLQASDRDQDEDG